MSVISRREFMKCAGAGAASAGFLSVITPEIRANPLGLPIGCQTWPVRQMIAKDFPGTVKMLAAAGFQSIELCSPIGYAQMGFANVGKYSGAELPLYLPTLAFPPAFQLAGSGICLYSLTSPLITCFTRIAADKLGSFGLPRWFLIL